MRFFSTFEEAQNEIARDLAELGVRVHTETMQDKDIADDPDFDTKELFNYSYCVTSPNVEDIEGVHENWVKSEWADRVVGGLNPGKSWRERPDVWTQFLENHSERHTGRFSYTYSQRMGGPHIQKVIDELKEHPHSRQLWLPVWHEIDEKRRGKQRVPCSLGYQIMYRRERLHLTYVMRSCDFHTHYPNDVALATLLLDFICNETGFAKGSFTHFAGSLHVYAKDVADVF